MLDCTQSDQRGALGFGHARQSGNVKPLVVTIAPQRAQGSTAASVPQPDNSVVTAAGDELTVSAERNAPDDASVAGQLSPTRAVAHIPQTDRAVNAATGNPSAITAQRHAVDGASVAGQSRLEPTAIGVPEPHDAVHAAAHREATIFREDYTPGRVSVRLQDV